MIGRLEPLPRQEPARERWISYQAPPPARQSAASLRPITAGTPFPLERHLVAVRGERPLYAFAEIIKWPKQSLYGFARTVVKPAYVGTVSGQKVSRAVPE